MADERDEIRARIDIVDLISRHGIALKKTGKNWKGLCPFHPDKNPSFNVSPSIQRYNCWSCGESGDIFTWVMKTQKLEFVEALEVLAKQAGVQLKKRSGESTSNKAAQQAAMDAALAFFIEALNKSSDAKAYCDGRGLTEDVRKAWELGYAPDVGDALASNLKKNGFSLAECKTLFLVDQDASGGYYDKFRGRLIFPTRNERGELVAFGGRILGDGVPKYINSGDTPLYRKGRVLHGLDRAKDKINTERQAVLVEGYLDVIACHRAGVETAIASLGTSLSEDHAKILKRWCDRVVVLYDSDSAGEKAASRAAEILAAEGLTVKVALMPAGEDPDTLLRTEGPEAVQRAVTKGITPLEHKIRDISKRLKPDQDEYWNEVVAALATAKNPIELDRFVVGLASKWPGTTDSLQAQKSLRAWIARVRRNQARPEAVSEPVVRAVVHSSAPEMSSSEATVLKAVLDEELRALAWTVAVNADMLYSRAAIETCEGLLSAFPEGPPTGPASVWLDKLEPAVAEVFSRLEFQENLAVTETFLSDAIARLERKRSERALHSLRSAEATMDDDKLREIMDGLRRLHNPG